MKLITDYAYTNDHKEYLIGYWFEAENEMEEKQLSIIRNQIFFGLNEFGTYPKYAGRIDNKSTNLVKAIGYEVPANVKRIGQTVIDNLSDYTKERILNK